MPVVHGSLFTHMCFIHLCHQAQYSYVLTKGRWYSAAANYAGVNCAELQAEHAHRFHWPFVRHLASARRSEPARTYTVDASELLNLHRPDQTRPDIQFMSYRTVLYMCSLRWAGHSVKHCLMSHWLCVC